jgi:RNA polymerase sigma-70 factor (ECF subfamily)
LNPSLPQESFVPEEDLLPPLEMVTDADWRDSIERLYRNRAAGLIQHFAGETRDRDGARDLVHEAFSRLAALGFARRLTVTRPDSYLFRICLNLFHDRGRAEVTHRAMEVEAQSLATFHNPIVHLESRDTLRRLEKAMLGLKPKTRAIFLARRLDGLSYVAIAERTGLSVKGVEKQMAKAIATIDRLMERERS